MTVIPTMAWVVTLLIAIATVYGAAITGSTTLAVIAGVAVGATLQGIAGWMLLRVHGASQVRFLVAFGRTAALRVFGGAMVVFVVFATGRVPAGAFLAGFGGAYVVLEIVVDVLFVRNEKQLSLGD